MVSYPGPVLASLAEYPRFGDSVLFQINGLVVVFVALSSIWAVMELMGLFFRRRRRADSPVPALPKSREAQPAAAETSPAGGPRPEIIAIIAASVEAVLGARHRIRAITLELDSHDWAREGRRDLLASHRLH